MSLFGSLPRLEVLEEVVGGFLTEIFLTAATLAESLTRTEAEEGKRFEDQGEPDMRLDLSGSSSRGLVACCLQLWR